MSQALEAAYQSAESPVGAELVEALLSRHLEDMESTLTRQGYGLKELVQNFDAKPAEIKALFANQLDPDEGRRVCETACAWPDCRFESSSVSCKECGPGPDELQSRADDCSLSCS